MEESLLQPNNYVIQNAEKTLPTESNFTLSPELQTELFGKDHEHLLRLRFERFPCTIFGVTEGYYRQSAKIFWPLRFALYASGAFFVKDDQVPKELGFIDEAKVYFNLTVHIAKMCKINTEEGISKVSPFDYERENVRRIWWLLYRNYSTAGHLFSDAVINEHDNQLLLPSCNFCFESPGPDDYFGVDIMNSAEWHTITTPNLNLDTLHMILQRIQVKLKQYFEMHLSNNNLLSLYAAGAINASLTEWMESFLPQFRIHLSNIIRNTQNDLEIDWYAIYLALVYCKLRISLVLPMMMKNIIKGKNVTKQLYFEEARQAAISSAQIVSLLNERNPNLYYVAASVIFALFPVGFFLQCCMKLGLENTKEPYNMVLFGVKRTSVGFQKTDSLYSILSYLENSDLVESVLYFGIFTRRQRRDFAEYPTPNHIDLMDKLDLNK
ncbi:hypothetical protein HDV04_000778 [Boothiomyces sp. JEL0838]|nr:hypothetical protein HDV04_000778 [Boothiomyces sp. JEL0838]